MFDDVLVSKENFAKLEAVLIKFAVFEQIFNFRLKRFQLRFFNSDINFFSEFQLYRAAIFIQTEFSFIHRQISLYRYFIM